MIRLPEIAIRNFDRGALRCEKCKQVIQMHAGATNKYIDEGWPECHGTTMTLVTQEELPAKKRRKVNVERPDDGIEPLTHFVCTDECGSHVAADEDECCATCGADCVEYNCDCPDAVKIATLRETAAKLLHERLEENEKLREILKWAEALVDGASCAFCAPPYVQNIASLVLAREHMPKCEHHPLHAARARVAELEANLRDLDERHFLDCIVTPSCGNCTVCRARRALEGKAG